MLLSYVRIFTAVTPAVVGLWRLGNGCGAVSGPTSPRPRTAPHEASPPFRQSLLSIARGTVRSDAPRMRRRPGTFRTRELSYRRLSPADHGRRRSFDGLDPQACSGSRAHIPCIQSG